MLPAILEAAEDLSPDQALSGEALRTLWTLLCRLSPSVTVETGAGASTAVFSQLSDLHWAFTNDSISTARLSASPLVRADTVRFIVGPSQRTLPTADLPERLDAVLLDGPHAYPFPDLEYFHLYPKLTPGGLLVLDDLQIPTVRGLYRFLRWDEMFSLELRIGRTAFFRRTEAPTFSPLGDGWERQRANRLLFGFRGWSLHSRSALGRAARWAAGRRLTIDALRGPVGPEETISGRSSLAAGHDLWVLARREGQGGWWPQCGGPVARRRDGSWLGSVRFGDAHDVGARFEVLVVAVGSLTSARWRAWITAKDDRPVQLPPEEFIAARRMRIVHRKT